MVTTNFSPDEPSVWSPAGRIGRGRYFGLIVLFSFLTLPVTWALEFTVARSAPPIVPIILFLLLLLLPLIYLGFVTGAKRLHDFGSSGWWQLLGLIPLVNIGFGIYVLFKEGDAMPNAYGPPHGQRGVYQTFAYAAQRSAADEPASRPVAVYPFAATPASAPAASALASREAVPAAGAIPPTRAAQVAQPLPPVPDGEVNEEALWAAALKEFEGPSRRKGLWARLFAEAGGVENTAQAAYLSARVEEMRQDIQAQQAAAIQAREDAIRLEAEALHALAAAALDRARQAKGVCPNCQGWVAMNDQRCPHCEASFGEGASWKPQPAPEQAHDTESALTQLTATGFVVETIQGGWQVSREAALVAYAYSPIDLMALAALARAKRPLQNWIEASAAQAA